MKIKAVRLHGENDLRLEEIELPAITSGEILIKIICDSVCMSTYKTAKQGAKHLRVPDDVAQNPTIVGHEFCAEIVEVGEKWKDQYAVGEKVIIPPVLAYLGGNKTIGYSFTNIGGLSTYSIVEEHVLRNGFLMKLSSDSFFCGSLTEPVSCVLRGYKSNYQMDAEGVPATNIKPGGQMALLAGCGPMGLVAIDCALHGDIRPSKLVVTDIDAQKLARAKSLFSPEDAAKDGIELIFTNASSQEELMELSGGAGFDDVFVYAPVPALVELADSLLAFDGCLNFFAGPMDKNFSATVDFYKVHYAQHHFAGSSGSTPADVQDAVSLLGQSRINPATMITHIGGMNVAIETTVNLPSIPGGKKLIYTHIDLPLCAIAEFEELGKTDARFSDLHEIVSRHNGLWCAEAEQYLLTHFSK